MRRWGMRVGIVSAAAVLSVAVASAGVVWQLQHKTLGSGVTSEFGGDARLVGSLLADVIARGGWFRSSGPGSAGFPDEIRAAAASLEHSRVEAPALLQLAAVSGRVGYAVPEGSDQGAAVCTRVSCFALPGIWHGTSLGLRSFGGPDAQREILTASQPAFALSDVPRQQATDAEQPRQTHFAPEQVLERSEKATAGPEDFAEPAPARIQREQEEPAPPVSDSELLFEAVERPVGLNGDWVGGSSGIAAEVFERAIERAPIEEPGSVLGIPTFSPPKVPEVVAEAVLESLRVGEENALAAEEVPITSTPEPGALWLLASGLLALSIADFMRRRRFRG